MSMLFFALFQNYTGKCFISLSLSLRLVMNFKSISAMEFIFPKLCRISVYFGDAKSFLALKKFLFRISSEFLNICIQPFNLQCFSFNLHSISVGVCSKYFSTSSLNFQMNTVLIDNSLSSPMEYIGCTSNILNLGEGNMHFSCSALFTCSEKAIFFLENQRERD